MDYTTGEICYCDHCKVHQSEYNIISDRNRKIFLTVSPPADDSDPECYNRYWLDRFTELLKCADHLIGVTEFANNRMHFHIVYSCTDAVKSYKLVNTWAKEANCLAVKSMPKKGLHYLFKDISDSTDLIANPIFTLKSLETLKQSKVKPKSRIKRPNVLDPPEINKISNYL